MAKRMLQIEDTIDVIGQDVAIYKESDVPPLVKIGESAPEPGPATWGYAFVSDDYETIWLGYASKDEAISEAYSHRRDQLADQAVPE